MRIVFFSAAIVAICTFDARAETDSFAFRARAHEIAIIIQTEFECKRRGCLTKAIIYGGKENTIPEKYRAMMKEKFSALGEASEKEGRAVAGILAVFIGACTWRPDDCAGVLINSAHRNKSGVGSARHTNDFGTRAFDFVGFKNIEHQVRFLTRMALVAEEMGLEPNIGLGRSEGVQITHFDVNGSELTRSKQCHKECTCKQRKGKKSCNCKRTCTSRAGSRTWEYGPRETLQSLLQGEIENDRISDNFIKQVLGVPTIPVVASEERQEELPFGTVKGVITFFGPGSNSSIEGPWKTAKDNLELGRDSDGDGVPRTLDDVRRGKFSYVTLASAPENLGKFYYMGSVTYTSPIDRKTYTLQHVVGYTHDTGGAFIAESCAKYDMCEIRLRKFDVAVGDFRGWPGRDTEKFVDDPILQAYGHAAEHVWQQFTWPANVAMPVVEEDTR